MKKTLITLGVLIVVLIAVSFFWDMSVDNKEIDLRKQHYAQVDVCKTSHDAMWKVIAQDAEITDKYKQDFEEIFPKIANNMMSDEAMFQWMAGFNPEYSPDLYKELMKTIKTERSKFKRAQDIAIDISREYKAYIQKKPATWMINNDILEALEYKKYSLEEVEQLSLADNTYEAYLVLSYKPVLSTKTNDVFKTGLDDDVKLFGNKEVDTSKQDSLR